MKEEFEQDFMIEEYNFNEICFVNCELMTLQEAIKKEKYIKYFDFLDFNTLGYIHNDSFYECSFVPVSFKGNYLREI